MKNLILILFLFAAFEGYSQQKPLLKDLLYGGKLKKDSTGVIRSTDDLSKKIDTSTKKEPEVVNAKSEPVNTKEDKQKAEAINDKNINSPVKAPDIKDSTSNPVDQNSNIPVNSAPANAPVSNVPAKTNARLWKDYSDSLNKILKAEVLNSRQIKKNTYFLLVDYELAPNGEVTVTNISSTPENAFLQAQVKQIMETNPPRLNANPDANSQTKKVKRRQQIVVTKE